MKPPILTINTNLITSSLESWPYRRRAKQNITSSPLVYLLKIEIGWLDKAIEPKTRDKSNIRVIDKSKSSSFAVYSNGCKANFPTPESSPSLPLAFLSMLMWLGFWKVDTEQRNLPIIEGTKINTPAHGLFHLQLPFAFFWAILFSVWKVNYIVSVIN